MKRIGSDESAPGSPFDRVFLVLLVVADEKHPGPDHSADDWIPS